MHLNRGEAVSIPMRTATDLPTPPAEMTSEPIPITPQGRRFDDLNPRLLLARSSADLLDAPGGASAAGTIAIEGVQVGTAGGPVQEWTPGGRDEQDDTIFLLDLGDEDAILVAGSAVRRIPRGQGGNDLMGRAASGAAVWRQERMRTWRRAQLPESLIAFSEQLNRAEAAVDVSRALVESAPAIIGGYTAVVMAEVPGTDSLEAVEIPNLPYEVRHLRLPALPRFKRPGVITAQEARPDTGSPFSGLSALVADIGAAVMAHAPYDRGVLILVDRRHDRVFGPEEWDLLGTLSRQADAAMKRVRLFQEVHNLSLADPLTGLANRRQMKIVLERELAAARRGEGLALVMLDMDDFKEINDRQGHLAGDRILVTVADVLRREARGADLVVRYGGDEFLVVLPGGTAGGASAFVRRVRERLPEAIEISAGVAEYAPHLTSVEQLIDAADRNLYLSKQHRKQWKS